MGASPTRVWKSSLLNPLVLKQKVFGDQGHGGLDGTCCAGHADTSRGIVVLPSWKGIASS
eukprot:4756959-Amphidinium_carterae.1